jgi:hypothetical protein
VLQAYSRALPYIGPLTPFLHHSPADVDRSATFKTPTALYFPPKVIGESYQPLAWIASRQKVCAHAPFEALRL